ncbi:Uncharacterised protein [Klebsiella pneumoniae]|nr:Uncharacterised protein [Klebsiella pneumoniae]
MPDSLIYPDCTVALLNRFFPQYYQSMLYKINIELVCVNNIARDSDLKTVRQCFAHDMHIVFKRAAVLTLWRQTSHLCLKEEWLFSHTLPMQAQ